MEHVVKLGVSVEREFEDVLLAHLGLVPSLERPGRPLSVELNERLCARLQIDVAGLGDWLAAQHARVERQLQILSWQAWGTDNQIIASVQTLLNECAAVMGREKPEWKEHVAAADLGSKPGVLATEELSRSRSRSLLSMLSLRSWS